MWEVEGEECLVKATEDEDEEEEGGEDCGGEERAQREYGRRARAIGDRARAKKALDQRIGSVKATTVYGAWVFGLKHVWAISISCVHVVKNENI